MNVEQDQTRQGKNDAAATHNPDCLARIMGLNDNLTFLGREIHVQTENATFPAAHIVTHVFARGRILLSRKRDYPIPAGTVATPEQIQSLMRGQHLAVIQEITEKQKKIQGGQ